MSACTTANPNSGSPRAGAAEIRERVGFNPYTPQHEAGIRIDPAPSEAPAAAVIPAATAEAEPPLDPPAVRSRFQGLRHGPCASGSEVEWFPNSGELVLPANTTPAARYRAVISLSWPVM